MTALVKPLDQEITEAEDPLSSALDALWKSDLRAVLSLLALGVCLYLPGISTLEFIRHTEADRTLIAWEMLTRREFLVPHLLGTPILTKPPMFYWLVASFISFFGSAAEWVPRLVTVIAAIGMLLVQYTVARVSGMQRRFSFFSSAVLATSVLYYTHATVAEIDMLFTLCTATSLYLLFLALLRQSPRIFIFSYILASLAFLTKGPPVVLFYGFSLLGFLFWSARRREVPSISFRSLLIWNGLGALCFSAIVLGWLWLAAESIGWDLFESNFDREIVQRIFQSSERHRGPLFYLLHLVIGLGGWGLFFLVGLGDMLHERLQPRRVVRILKREERIFLAFNAITLFGITLMLSFAEGKSSRYLLPALPFAATCTVFLVARLRDSKAERGLFRFAASLGFIAFPVLCYFIFGISYAGVSQATMALAAVILFAPIVLLSIASHRRSRIWALAGIVFVMLGLRYGQANVYTPHRNETRSVKALAAEIDASLPPGVPLYVIEMSERWIAYYLKLRGRETLRLWPKNASGPKMHNGRVYILLNAEEESWRVHELRRYDPSVRVRTDLTGGNNRMLLVESGIHALPYLSLKKVFPTQPSYPQFPAIPAENSWPAP